MRILLAEDHAIAAELLCLMGKRLGADIDWVENGLDAVDSVLRARAAGDPYLLVLMDAMMPVLTGIEATRRIRAAGIDAASLPIVAVTAATANEEVRDMLEAGMQAYLAKPVSLADLSACIDAWIEPRRDAAAPELVSSFVALRRRYELPKEEIFAELAAAVTAGDCSENARTELRNHLHKLAGTAGSFGESGLSVAAAEGAQLLAETDPATLPERLRRTGDLLRAAA